MGSDLYLSFSPVTLIRFSKKVSKFASKAGISRWNWPELNQREKLSRRTFSSDRLEQKKNVAHLASHTWNLLYVSANSAAAATARDLSVSKSDILSANTHTDDLAVRVALAEADLIKKTQDWLTSEGLDSSLFQQEINSQSTDVSNKGIQRSKTILILKHLPADSLDEEKLKSMFLKFGSLLRFSVSPSKTAGLVEFAGQHEAAEAFKRLAFRRFGSVPLYIEYAPENIRSDIPKAESSVQYEGPSRLFVRNVPFEASIEDLRNLFQVCGPVSEVRLPKKVGENSHRGFAFIEYENSNGAKEALQRLNKTHLYGRRLLLESPKPDESVDSIHKRRKIE